MSDWIPIEAAAKIVAEGQTVEDARRSVLGAITESLVKARAFRRRKTSLSFPAKDAKLIESHLGTGKWVHELKLTLIGGEGE